MSVDLSAALFAAITGDSAITAALGKFNAQPSVHTRRPVPQSAEFPMIVVSQNVTFSDEDFLSASKLVISRDIAIYGKKDKDYRTVQATALNVRTLFHRKRFAIAPAGFHVIDIVATGPIEAPVDDDEDVGQIVTLTVRLQPE